MKKNWLMRTAYLVLAVLLISSVVVSGTFAKYTWASNTTTSSAQVAKFAFDINDTEVRTGAETIAINLFDTNKILDEKDDGTLADPETDVVDAGANIAPGMGGSFDLDIVNQGEVTITYGIEATITNTNNVPIVFATTNTAGTTWGTLADALTEVGTLNAGGAAAEQTIYWKWAFNPNDTNDTALGFGANAADIEYVVDLAVTVTQVN